MEFPIEITLIEEFEMVSSRGWQPLQDYKKFHIEINLRIAIQRELFGKSLISKGSVVEANQRFYIWSWENNPHFCEECAKPLQEYSSKFISHIISRGARPDIAHDPRNKNILCFEHHQKWENETQRKTMRIYKTNLKIIEILNNDYQ